MSTEAEPLTYEQETQLAAALGEQGRALLAADRERLKLHVKRYGIPWWVEPDAELVRLCPLRLVPPGWTVTGERVELGPGWVTAP